MILLTSTSDLIEVTSGATSILQVQASYVDLLAGQVTPARTNTSISTATTTTVVVSPAANTQRTLKFLSIQNTGVAETVTVIHTDGVTPVNLQKLTLNAGYTLVYNEGSGWSLFDNGGNFQTAIGPGRLLKTTVVLTGTTSFTTTAATNSIVARLVGAGGAGGGSPATTGENGSGGGGGAYAEWETPVSPSTAYVCAIAASATGVSAANGNAGGNTTLTVGGTTCTAFGGSGGLVSASIAIPVLGGAGGVLSTNGTVNTPGDPGEPNGATGTALNNRSGAGASTVLGAGGAALLNASNAVGNSAAALGFGGGGGGASTTGTAHAGGASGPGVLIIQEYS